MGSFVSLAGRFLCVLLAATVTTAGDATYDEAIAAFGRGDYESAASKFQALIDSRPPWAQGHVMLGQCLYMLDHPDEAERSIRTAVEIDPETDLYAAHTGAGQLLIREKKYLEATRPLMQALEHAVESDKRSAGLKLGYAYYNGERYKDAARTLAAHHHQQSSGFDPQPTYYLALACQRSGDYLCAIKNLVRLKGTEFGANPRRKVLPYLAEWSHYWALVPENKAERTVLLEAAVEHTRTWHLASPDSPKATEYYGRTLLAAREAQQLVDDLVPIVARRPADCVARTLIARAYNDLDRRAEAEQWSREAGSCDTDSAEARLELAAALAGQLKPEHSSLEEVRRDQALAKSAIEAIERALQLDPDSGSRAKSLRVQLGGTLDQLDEAAAAFATLSEDYEIQIDQADLDAVRDRCVAILWQMRDESRGLSPEGELFYRGHDCKQYAGTRPRDRESGG